MGDQRTVHIAVGVAVVGLALIAGFGGVRLGSVPDSAEFQTGLDSYIRNTMPTWAVNGYLSRGVEFRTQYSRTGSETNEDDMILLVTGMAPVLYSDGSGYVSMA